MNGLAGVVGVDGRAICLGLAVCKGLAVGCLAFACLASAALRARSVLLNGSIARPQWGHTLTLLMLLRLSMKALSVNGSFNRRLE